MFRCSRPFGLLIGLALLSIILGNSIRPAALYAAPISEVEPNNSNATAQVLATTGYDSPVSAEINSAGDIDWFSFSAVAGRSYVIEIFNAAAALAGQGMGCTGSGMTFGEAGLGMRVFTSTGTKLIDECDAVPSSAGNSHHAVTVAAPSSGMLYVVLVANDANASGFYNMHVLPKYDQPGASWDNATFEPNNVIWNAYALALGENSALTSEIGLRNPIYSSYSPDKDWFRFVANAGQSYVVDLFDVSSGLLGAGLSCSHAGITGGSGLSLLISNEADSVVAGECSASGKGNGTVHHRVQFVASVSGQYHIRITPNDGNAAGSYSVRVCLTSCNLSTVTPTATSTPTATFTPTTIPESKSPWLVLIYMAGDDVFPGTATPTSFARAVNEALFRLKRMPVNPALHLFVLYDGPAVGDTRIYRQKSQGLADVTEEAAASTLWTGGFAGSVGQRELDTGDLVTLGNFIDWARATAPATSYSMLSIIDHGGGWAPDFDDPPGQPHGIGRVQAGGWRGMSLDMNSGGSSLSTRDTGQALAGIQHFDVLFYDACLMGMIETAYEVRKSADFLVVGQNLLFAELPYERYLSSQSLTASTEPKQLAEQLVKQYNAGIDAYRHPFTLAAIDLRQLRSTAPTSLAIRVNTLAERMLQSLPSQLVANDPFVQALFAVYAESQKFDYDSSLTLDPKEGYVDLVDFAQKLSTSSSTAIPATVKDAAQAVIQAAESVVIARHTVSGSYEHQPWNLDSAHGLSIFLPLGERDERPTRVLTDGQPAISEPQLPYYVDPTQLAFSHDMPAWATLLQALEPAVPSQRTGQSIDRRAFRATTQQTVIRTLFLPLAMR